MATPGMSWQQQQHYYSGASSSTGAGKFAAPPPSSAASSQLGMEYNQDLHLKMSKKIAQLTKYKCILIVGNAVGSLRNLTMACADKAVSCLVLLETLYEKIDSEE
ncbi:UNVERIFIED_CONTAM: hypothetical protein K2H54_070741 [Gekko kuhli]